MKALVKNSSAIRAMFVRRKNNGSKIRAENVYDFSLENPNVPAPVHKKQLSRSRERNPIVRIGYMSNAGYEEVLRQ